MTELNRLVTHALAKARLRLHCQTIAGRFSRSSGLRVRVDGERNAIARTSTPANELWEDILHTTGLCDLNPVHLELLRRRWFYHERLIDLADELGITHSNARSIVHRARKVIQERYRDCLSSSTTLAS